MEEIQIAVKRSWQPSPELLRHLVDSGRTQGNLSLRQFIFGWYKKLRWTTKDDANGENPLRFGIEFFRELEADSLLKVTNPNLFKVKFNSYTENPLFEFAYQVDFVAEHGKKTTITKRKPEFSFNATLESCQQEATNFITHRSKMWGSGQLKITIFSRRADLSDTQIADKAALLHRIARIARLEYGQSLTSTNKDLHGALTKLNSEVNGKVEKTIVCDIC